MPVSLLPLPAYESIQSHIQKSLSRYWPQSAIEPGAIPVLAKQGVGISGPLVLNAIQLPDWALEHGVDGKILVPTEACGGGDNWQQVDWWLAAFLLLECWHERTWELNHGPIHSYGFRLQGWDFRAWDHAWVNRIALFMRTWSAREQSSAADELFGPLPVGEVLMTHDVDAVSKTMPIRLKQGAFNLFNAARHLAHADGRKAFERLGSAMRFFFGREDWWTFDILLASEKQADIRAQFNFYADTRKQTFRSWLFDPRYDIHDTRLEQLLQNIQKQHALIGLHPSYDAWNSSATIGRQREQISMAAHQSVTDCRQHWLRFGWSQTWSAQEAAGVGRDLTLMFNDRAGYRASAALAWQPWNQNMGCAHRLTEQPTIMMDSHFFDYHPMDAVERKTAISRWIDETMAVGGQAAVLWHPHALTKDYGWADGFRDLLDALIETKSCPRLH